MVDHKDPIAKLSDLMSSSSDGLHKLDELTPLIAGAAVKGHAFDRNCHTDWRRKASMSDP
jgi:hypothetical protein